MSATLARVQKSFKWQPKNQVGPCVNWRAKKERAFFFAGIYSLIEASRLLYDASSTSKWCRVTRLFKDIYSQMKAVSQEELSRGKRPAVKRPARRIYCLLSALRTRRELSSWNGLKEKNHGDQRTDMVVPDKTEIDRKDMSEATLLSSDM